MGIASLVVMVPYFLYYYAMTIVGTIHYGKGRPFDYPINLPIGRPWRVTR